MSPKPLSIPNGKVILHTLVLFISIFLATSFFGQTPSFRSFNTNDFTTNAFLIGTSWTTNSNAGGISNKYELPVLIDVGSGGMNFLNAPLAPLIVGGSSANIVSNISGAGIRGASIFSGLNNEILSRNGQAAYSIILGGQLNLLSNANHGIIVGGTMNTNLLGSTSAIVSGQENTVSNASGSVIASGVGNLIEGGSVQAIGGGNVNKVFGGTIHTENPGLGIGHTIVGGLDNVVSNVFGGSVVGGESNTARDGDNITVFGAINSASSFSSTVSGGQANTADGGYSSVGGGLTNIAGGLAAVVSGGQSNQASDVASTVSGGLDNWASGSYATVAGGLRNTATAAWSASIGGSSNSATGTRSVTLGGEDNRASAANTVSFGSRASADDAGSFVWSDRTAGFHSSRSNDTFNVRAAKSFFDTDLMNIDYLGGGGISVLSANNAGDVLKFSDDATAADPSLFLAQDGSWLPAGGAGDSLWTNNVAAIGGISNLVPLVTIIGDLYYPEWQAVSGFHVLGIGGSGLVNWFSDSTTGTLATDYLGADGSWHTAAGGGTFNVTQFDPLNGATNIIRGAQFTNVVINTESNLFTEEMLVLNRRPVNTNFAAYITVTNGDYVGGEIFSLRPYQISSASEIWDSAWVRVQGIVDVTNRHAALLRTVVSNSMIYLTNGSAARWATIGFNTTNSGTNVSPYYGLISPDMNPGAVDAGLRRESSTTVVLENPQGTVQKNFRAGSVFSGNRLETYAGLWIGTNATEELIISGKDSGTPNRHWANHVVITNTLIAGTNNLDGPGSTPTRNYGTNFHAFALPANSIVWSIVGAEGGYPAGVNFIRIPVVMHTNLVVGTNTSAAEIPAIHSTNVFQVASGDSRAAIEVNNLVGKVFVNVPSTVSGLTNRANYVVGGVGGPTWSSGSGTPEGAVTAPVGSLFSRTDGGAATTLYVKESGSGNTGWVAK